MFRPSCWQSSTTSFATRAMESFMRDLARGAFTYAPPALDELSRAMDIDRRYSDLGLGLVDGSVIALAEGLGIRIRRREQGDARKLPEREKAAIRSPSDGDEDVRVEENPLAHARGGGSCGMLSGSSPTSALLAGRRHSPRHRSRSREGTARAVAACSARQATLSRRVETAAERLIASTAGFPSSVPPST
jgi:hypothetical protein